MNSDFDIKDNFCTVKCEITQNQKKYFFPCSNFHGEAVFLAHGVNAYISIIMN